MSIRQGFQNYLLGQSGVTDVVDRRIVFGTYRGAATGLLTLTSNVSNTETVTVGDNTYTFEDSLTNVANNVLVGGTRNDSIANLIAAITRASGNGTAYAEATVRHPKAWARRDVSATMTAFGRRKSIEALVTTETLSNGSWGQATLNVYPYVVVTELFSRPGRHFGAGDGLAETQFQVDCWSDKETEAASAGDAIFGVTHGKNAGNIGSPAIDVRDMTVTNNVLLPGPMLDGSETLLSRRMLEITLWHAVSVPTF